MPCPAPLLRRPARRAGARRADPGKRRLRRRDLERAGIPPVRQAKSALRSLVAFGNKGVTAIDFYAAKDDKLGLVDPAFFSKPGQSGGAYPGDDAGGETPTAVRRLMQAFQGAGATSTPRQLALTEVSDSHNHKQFDGDGTAAHPPLYNRDVVAFLPLPADRTTLRDPPYVMTRTSRTCTGRTTHVGRNPLRPAGRAVHIDHRRRQLEHGALERHRPARGHDVPVRVLLRTATTLRVQVRSATRRGY